MCVQEAVRPVDVTDEEARDSLIRIAVVAKMVTTSPYDG